MKTMDKQSNQSAKTNKHGDTYGNYAREHAHEQSHTLKRMSGGDIKRSKVTLEHTP